MQKGQLLTVPEAAEILGCRPSTLYDKIAHRQIAFIRLWAGKRKTSIRFTRELLAEHVERSVMRPRNTAA